MVSSNGSVNPSLPPDPALQPPPGMVAAPPIPGEAMEAWEMDAGGPLHTRSLESVLKLPPTDPKGQAPRRVTSRKVPADVWDALVLCHRDMRIGDGGKGGGRMMNSVCAAISWLGAAKLYESDDFIHLRDTVETTLAAPHRNPRRYLRGMPEFQWHDRLADVDRVNVAVHQPALDMLQEIGVYCRMSDSMLVALALTVGIGAAEEDGTLHDSELAGECRIAFMWMSGLWQLYAIAVRKLAQGPEQFKTYVAEQRKQLS